MHPKLNPNGIQTHDLQIMIVQFSYHWNNCSNHLAISNFQLWMMQEGELNL